MGYVKRATGLLVLIPVLLVWLLLCSQAPVPVASPSDCDLEADEALIREHVRLLPESSKGNRGLQFLQALIRVGDSHDDGVTWRSGTLNYSVRLAESRESILLRVWGIAYLDGDDSIYPSYALVAGSYEGNLATGQVVTLFEICPEETELRIM